MPIHDWKRVPPGVFHHLHGTWLFELAGELNEGILPDGFYALGEQVVGGAVPDVITLERPREPAAMAISHDRTSPAPSATILATAEHPAYPPRPRVVAIRHVSGDRVVAIVEIVSAGNKKEACELGALVDKTIRTLESGVHVVLVDVLPPGTFDPDGLHNVVWRELGQEPSPFDADRGLQVTSYRAGREIQAYIEPRRVGEALPDIPLFLGTDLHVPLPLERSYTTAFSRLPAHLRPLLEDGASP